MNVQLCNLCCSSHKGCFLCFTAGLVWKYSFTQTFQSQTFFWEDHAVTFVSSRFIAVTLPQRIGRKPPPSFPTTLHAVRSYRRLGPGCAEPAGQDHVQKNVHADLHKDTENKMLQKGACKAPALSKTPVPSCNLPHPLIAWMLLWGVLTCSEGPTLWQHQLCEHLPPTERN